MYIFGEWGHVSGDLSSVQTVQLNFIIERIALRMVM